VLSITVESVKNYVTAGSFAPLVIAVLVVFLIANKVIRTVVLLIAVALGLVIFSQRAKIDECADKLTRSSDPTAEKCPFFGYEFRLDLNDPVSSGA
jgi:ABC-type uncharacterized transport system permease subunit